MPTPKHPPTTRLGTVIRSRRGRHSQIAAAQESGIPDATLSRIERGTSRPSPETARALATWLGWTLEQVFEAAERPAGEGSDG